jgi:alpha-tubulin suppressor-like RCC1 family protein
MVYRVNLDTSSGTSLNTLFSKSMTANMTASMSPTNLTSTITIANLRFRQITAGGSTCGITDTYATYCWGANSNGQVGNNSTTNVLLPVQISQGAIPTGVVLKSIDADQYTVCAIGSNESSYCWGSDVDGVLGNGDVSYQNSLVPSLVLKGAIPANVTLKSISVGSNYACGVGTNNKVYCWGSNVYGQLGNGESSNNYYNTPVAVSDGEIPPTTKLLSVSAGAVTTCATGSDGEVYCWGSNSGGMLGNGTSGGVSVTPVLVSQGSVPAPVSLVSVVNGTTASCALGNDGNSYCWGQGYLLGNNNNFTIQSSPAPVTQTSSGVFNSIVTTSLGVICGINNSGAAYCWGSASAQGQLGNGTTNTSGIPVAVLPGQVPIGTTFTSIAAGYATCGIGTNYFAYCWGDNLSGSIGNNTTTNSSTAVAVCSPTGC